MRLDLTYILPLVNMGRLGRIDMRGEVRPIVYGVNRLAMNAGVPGG